MKNLKQINQLMAAANDLLNDSNECQRKWEKMLQHNVEHAEPLGELGWSDEILMTEWQNVQKLMASYFLIIDNIKTYEL